MPFRTLLAGAALLCSFWGCTDGSGAENRAGSSSGGAQTAGVGAGATQGGLAGDSQGGKTSFAGKSGATSGGGGSAGTSTGVAGTNDAAGGGANNAGAAGMPAIGLPSGVTGLFPLPGSENVCADPALRLRFANAPELGNTGKLRVFDASSPSTPVVTVDFGATAVTRAYGGQSYQQPRPVFLEGNDVVVPLLSNALGYGKQYFVTLEAGAIKPGSGAFAIDDPQEWHFSTLATAPTGSKLSVALDGSGQFCSWQGALDAVPAKNTAAVSIEIKSGVYHGLVNVTEKQNITLHGQDRKQTILSGINNDQLNAGTRARSLFGAESTNGLVIDNVTIRNLTPQGGTQAEALRLQGCEKCMVLRSNLLSLQDTLMWSGVIYAEDCYIAGNVDWIWGDGAVYFNRCEIKNVGRSGFIVQARNGANEYGYVFVDSKLTADPGITGSTLARIDASVYPSSNVAYIDCTLGSHISKAGWTVTGDATPTSLRFWEYQSKDENGALIDVSERIFGKQISAEQAARLRDPSVVLGGWQPPR